MARKISRRKARQIDRSATDRSDSVPVGATSSGPWTVTDALGNLFGPFDRSTLLDHLAKGHLGFDWQASDGSESLRVREALLRPDPASLPPAQPQTFATEDEMNPTYCPGCRRPVPTAEAAQYNGYCRQCAQWFAAAEEARNQVHEAEQQAAQAARAAQEAERQEIHNTDTGMGRCPSCGSPNTTRIRKTEDDTAAQAGFCCCMGGCVAWPLALLAPFLFRSRSTWGKCNACGHEWPL